MIFNHLHTYVLERLASYDVNDKLIVHVVAADEEHLSYDISLLMKNTLTTIWSSRLFTVNVYSPVMPPSLS